MSRDDDFELDEARRQEGEPSLLVDVGGFEGPLDLLLDLARRQKVDLAEISILALAEQYLAFVEAARSLRLELAADYLVMAAWLAYLKSRLLLPEPPKAAEPSAGELATALAIRLRRLEAIRAAAARLGERAQLGRDVFPRGVPDPVAEAAAPRPVATLFDLLSAYATQRQRRVDVSVVVGRRDVWALAEARSLLERLAASAGEDWVDLDLHLRAVAPRPEVRRTALASTLSAALEMVREGRASLQQAEPFAPLLFRASPTDPAAQAVA